MTTTNFDGRVALVTGAGGGLGRSHALLLASRGACVVVNDVGGSLAGAEPSPAPAQTVAAEINDLGGTAVADTNTVVTPGGGQSMIQTALETFGRIDIVINNAGILRDKSFANMTPDLWQPVLDVHLTGGVNVTRAAWPHLRMQGYGRILFTSSAAGIFGNFGQANYGAAKMGLVGLTRVLAQEGARYGIRVNAIAPVASTRMSEALFGGIDDLDPRLVSPVAAWLVSDECQISGEVYSAGAGRVARIFIAETPGFFKPGLTIEDVRDNVEQIRSEPGYVVPANAISELCLVAPFLSEPRFGLITSPAAEPMAAQEGASHEL